MSQLTAKEQLTPVDELDVATQPKTTAWTPKWIVDCGKDCEVGLTVDDHCFLVLIKGDSGEWQPCKHIPREAAKKMWELADDYL
jgi:hypothetical protein